MAGFILLASYRQTNNNEDSTLNTQHSQIMAAPKITHDEWLARFAAKHGGRYDYTNIAEIVSSVQRIEIGCPEHGVFAQLVYKHWMAIEHPCPTCRRRANGIKHRKGANALVEEIRAKFGDKYDCSEIEYINYKTPVALTCAKHGPFVQTPQLLRVGYGCPECGIEGGRIARKYQAHTNKPAGTFIAQAQQVHGDTYTYEKAVYLGAHTSLEVVCKAHGSFWQAPTNHLGGCGCPRCGLGGRISQIEDSIFRFVRDICPDAVQSDRKLIAPFEIDIYVPARALAIEVNGVFWHSDGKTDPSAHKAKRDACAAAGVRLLQFTDIEIESRRETVLRCLRHALGASRDVRLNARDCSVIEVPAETAKEFIETWHLQGAKAVSAHRFGLVHPLAGLVAVMTFGKDVYRRNRTAEDLGTLDLTRFATSAQVRGGASKLFTHARKHLGIKRCVSYSMEDWFDGGMYAQLGFQIDTVIPPDYRVYHHKTGLIAKQRWQRKFIADRITEIGRYDLLPYEADTDPRTERHMQDACGALRIFDSGKRRWIWIST